MTPEKYLQKARNLIKEKGRLTPTEIYTELGDPPKGYRLKSDGRGSVSIETRESRAGRRSRATAKRSKFDVASTPLAGYEAKKIKEQRSQVSAQAEMFGLEPTQIEHLADQADVVDLTAGAPGDPTNLLQVRQSEARYKDQVKLAVGKENAVTLNPSEETLRVIPKKFFDPIADPSTLPGVDIPIGTPIEDVRKTVTQVDFKGGGARLKGAGSALPLIGVAAGVLSAGQAFAAGDIQEGVARTAETVAGEIPIAGDIVQSEPVAGGTFEDVQRRTAEGLRAKQLQQRAAQARQQGGKVKFGFGGVKFTLPEFGLSELMGLN